MKKILMCGVALLLVGCANFYNVDSPSKEQKYNATLPCASCDRIEVKLTLHDANKEFEMMGDYYGNGKEGDYVTKGTYTVDEAKGIITLFENGSSEIVNKLKIMPNGDLVQLDSDDKFPKDPSAYTFKLNKI